MMEVIAGLLLLFRRTSTFGAIMAAGVFANVMIFDDNPKDGTLRTANGVTIRRGFARSFFNMLWLSVSTGIQQILTKKKGLKLG